ncbi:MAG TPA: DUF4345 family protein [Solirubrobacteraceae bacterium]|nr:DUF4345 family protein [Solirubrobacteraceae bacterium]
MLFLGYVDTLILAGAWGALFGRLDQPLLLGLDLDELAPRTQANVMSQYRFLRAIELGFGLFALIHRDEIHRLRPFNRLFLFTMSAGVGSRLLSLRRDGSPSVAMYVFAGFELVGVPVIFAYTRTTLEA